MKRISALLLALLIAFSACPAAVAADGSPVITIDGIRTAFFAPDGTYLPPLEENGILYVPFLSLTDSLGLEAEADPETLVLSVNGVRLALFAEDGSYLPPLEKDGILYVPLKAFAESIGLPLTAEGNTYTLSRKADSAPAPETTAAPAEHPEYAEIPLTLSNYWDYFILSQDYYAPSGYPSTYYITYTATIQASTSYGLKNVSFRLENYGRVAIPASGRASVSYQSDYLYGSSKDPDHIMSITRMETDAIFKTAHAPDVTEVSGYIRIPWSEAEAMWEKDYIDAVGRIDLVSTSSAYDYIIFVLENLAKQGYRDSAEQLEIARQKQKEMKEQEAKAAEEAVKNQYDAALAALEEGRYQEAVEAFGELAEKNYEDSAEKLEETRAAWNEADYRAAGESLAAGDYDAAIEIYTRLGDYKDSKEQLAAAQQQKEDALFALYEEDYLAAAALQDDCRFEEAREAFAPLAEAGYKDSASRQNGCEESLKTLETWEEKYQSGLRKEQEGDWGAALADFRDCLPFRNAGAHAAACVINEGTSQILLSESGGFLFRRGSESGYANPETNEFRMLDNMTVDFGDEQMLQDGLAPVRGDVFWGVIRASDGKLILPCEYSAVLSFGFGVQVQDDDGLHVFDTEGNDLFEDLLGERKVIAVNTYPGGNRFYTLSGRSGLLLTPDGRILEFAENVTPRFSNDGQIYSVRRDGEEETLLSPDGEELFTADRISPDPSSTAYDRSEEEIYQVHNGTVAFQKDRKWGLYNIDKKKIIVKPGWYSIANFTAGGSVRFTKDHYNNYGLANSAGKVIAKPTYIKIDGFHGGLARVRKKAKKKINRYSADVVLFGFINEAGKLAIPMNYLGAGDFSGGLGYTWVYKDDGHIKQYKERTKITYSLISADGKILWTDKESDLSYDYDRDDAILLIDGLIALPVKHGESFYNFVRDENGQYTKQGQYFNSVCQVVTDSLLIDRIDHYRSPLFRMINQKGETLKAWDNPNGAGEIIARVMRDAIQIVVRDAENTSRIYAVELYTLSMEPYTIPLPAEITENSRSDLEAAR